MSDIVQLESDSIALELTRPDSRQRPFMEDEVSSAGLRYKYNVAAVIFGCLVS